MAKQIYPLGILREDTIFFYDGQEYIRDAVTTLWFDHKHTTGDEKYSGDKEPDKEKNIKLVLCHPKLGGRYQTDIKLWFNTNTLIQF